MAYTTLNAPRSTPLTILARPFVTFFNLLVAIGAASGQARAVEVLNSTSDDELAARGVTRLDEVRRIFGSRLYL